MNVSDEPSNRIISDAEKSSDRTIRSKKKYNELNKQNECCERRNDNVEIK